MHTVQKLHTEKIECCKITPNGKYLISIGRDHLIKITDFSTYKLLTTIEHRDLLIPGAGCKFGISSNGKFLAVGSQSGNIFVFDLNTF